MNFKDFISTDTFTEQTSLKTWFDKALPLMEGNSTSSRYSIDINYRSKIKEVLEAYAKICLGFVSAALKQDGYHVKMVFEDSPIRIMVSSRNWDDGEWAGLIHFHPDHDGGSFIIGKGFYNRERKTISIQSSKKCDGDSAADITKELRSLMHSVKGQKDRHLEKLKPIPLKRGPK